MASSLGGTPLRAKLSLSMKEYRPVAIQIKENPTSSPNFEKTYVVQRGDTLSGISFAVYRDPSEWRAIAELNQIQDPRSIAPGTVLRWHRRLEPRQESSADANI